MKAYLYTLYHFMVYHLLPLTVYPWDTISTKKTFLSTPIKMQFNLSGCSIDHIGLCVLFTELKKSINHHTPVRVRLALNGNKVIAALSQEVITRIITFERFGTLCML